jgi:hypothetical protein
MVVVRCLGKVRGEKGRFVKAIRYGLEVRLHLNPTRGPRSSDDIEWARGEYTGQK